MAEDQDTGQGAGRARVVRSPTVDYAGPGASSSPMMATRLTRGASLDMTSEAQQSPQMFHKRKQFVRLKNILTGADMVDTLHQSGTMVGEST